MSDDITPQCSQLTQEVRYSEEICRWNSIQVSIVLVYLGGVGEGEGRFSCNTYRCTHIRTVHACTHVRTHTCMYTQV